jgi:hypothetical protein
LGAPTAKSETVGFDDFDDSVVGSMRFPEARFAFTSIPVHPDGTLASTANGGAIADRLKINNPRRSHPQVNF